MTRADEIQKARDRVAEAAMAHFRDAGHIDTPDATWNPRRREFWRACSALDALLKPRDVLEEVKKWARGRVVASPAEMYALHLLLDELERERGEGV